MATQFLLKDKIKVTKYYETAIPINSNTGNNEADICLSLINDVKPSVNDTTFFGGDEGNELKTPGTNLKFTDPTGSICSQTFAIASIKTITEHTDDEIVKDDILIGMDKDSNPINTFISKDSTSEPFLDNYLKIETTKNLGPFNSTNSFFQATFNKEDNSDLLSMAVNSAYNQDDKNGLLKIAEDTEYNNLYALGNDTSKYFTENANSKQLEVHDILSENRVYTNEIDIQTMPISTPLNDENFGTFKFVTISPNVNITTSADVTTLPLLLAPKQIYPNVKISNIILNPNNLVKKFVFSDLVNGDSDYMSLSELDVYDSNNKKLVWQTDFTIVSSTGFFMGTNPDYALQALFDNNPDTYINAGGTTIFTVTFTSPNGVSLGSIYLKNLAGWNRIAKKKLNFYDVNDTSLSDDIVLKDIPSLYSEADDYSILFTINNDNNSSIINYTNLPSSLTIDEFKEIFGDTIDISFKINVTKNQNTGFNFVNSSDNKYANLNNNTIVDNVDYIKNIVKLSHSLEIAQEPMSIDSDISNSNNNSSHFSLSTNGENLSSTDYNTDGEIKLAFDAPNNRVTNVTSSDAFEVIVDYADLTEELKITKDVFYELIDYLLPTGQGQYNSFADSNGTSLYLNTEEYTTIDFTSYIDVDNSVKIIKITPTFNVDAVTMYKLNDDNSLGYKIPVDITASLSGLTNMPTNKELRAKLFSKKISELGIQSINNALIIQDTISPTIDSNKWNLYFDPEYNNEYLMSSLVATSNSSNFPSIDKSTNMINNNETLDVTLSYISITTANSTGVLFDSIKIQYDDITTEISQQSLDFFNDSPQIHYYELLTNTNVNDYHIVKYVITETHQAKFMFPLSVFGNILMTTPLIKSVVTTYLYYSKSLTPSQDTIITIGANNDTITASKQKILTPAISSNITKLYKSTNTVSLNSNNDNAVLKFSINKKSLTPMNAIFQIESSESSSWESFGNIITDIDTYYGANQTITNQFGHSVNVIVCPAITNTDEILQLIDETYVISLQTDISNLKINVTGYNYPISNSLSLDVFTNPHYFINNDLPIGTDMNLSVDYRATLIDSNEYSIIINISDDTNIIAIVNMDITSFFGTFVIAKNINPIFYVDRTLSADSLSFINGDFSQSNPIPGFNGHTTSNNDKIPGWNVDAILIPTWNSWSYPSFLHGDNAISLQMASFIEQTINLQNGIYTVSFWLVGRPGGGPNPIDIQLNGETINTISPPTNIWTEYSVTFTISTAGNNTIRFAGTTLYNDLSTALQNVSITTSTFPTRHFIIGDETVSNGYQSGISSGVLDMTDGVKINYTDIRQDEYLKFNLLSDKISVSHVGSAGTPQYITHLDYESTNCEKVSIAYYRGYLNSNTTQTYKIVRKDLVTANVKATDTYVSNISGVYVNKEHVINFNDTISIGNKVQLLFSRLPNTILQNNKYIMNINVVGDSVKISVLQNYIETVINDKTLLDYVLYDFNTFNTDTQLISKGIQISSDLQYSIVYKSFSGKIYFVNDYKTNPSNIIWPSEEEYIVNFDDVLNLTLDTTITNTGLDTNGYINFKLSTNTLFDTTSYIVYAPPYLYATQATKYASMVFPFDINNSASELKTIYFPTTNYSGTELNQTKYLYEPFANILNTNNVTFTPTTIKSFADYNNSSKNMGVQTINITGSNIKLTELKSNNPETPSSNGPNRDGIIYNGTIGDLTNISNNYIKLLSNHDAVFQISYTQDLGGQFERIFGDIDVKHRGNIVINIGNSVLPDTNIILHNLVLNNNIVNIYDVYQVNHNNTLELYLLKYVYNIMIDYANIPGNTYLKNFLGSVDKFYYSQVQIPSVKLGDNISNVLKTITKDNLSFDSSNNIVWTEKLSFSNNLSLQITPLTQDGAVDMITLFYTDMDIPTNYTIVNIPNAYEVINGDGTYQTIITGLGKIKTQIVNTSDTPVNKNIDVSLPNNLTSNYADNNSALYDNEILFDTQIKSINDILFKFE